MIFRDNTATNGYCLCSDCQFGTYHGTLFKRDGLYYCGRYNEKVFRVGICNLFMEVRDDEADG